MYKEFEISTLNSSVSEIVSVKSSLELSSAIDNFIKKYTVGLVSGVATITAAYGDGETVTYVADNNFIRKTKRRSCWLIFTRRTIH